MTRIQRIVTAALATIAAAIILLWTPAQETWGQENTPPVIGEPTPTSLSLQYLFPRGEKAELEFSSEPVTDPESDATTVRFDFILTDDENDTTDPAGALFKVTANGNNFEFTAKDGVTPEDFTALYGNVVSHSIQVKMYANDGNQDSLPLSFTITAYHDASPRFQGAATYQPEQYWELDEVIEVYEGPQNVTDALQIPWTSTTTGARTWTLGNRDGMMDSPKIKCKDGSKTTIHTWDEAGSEDSALFAIDQPEGDQQQGHIPLRFAFAPDYEEPQGHDKDNEDHDKANTYLVRLVSSHDIHKLGTDDATPGCDGAALDLKVRVKDIGPPAPPTGLILSLQPNKPNHLGIHWDTPHANQFIEDGTRVDFPDPSFNITSIVISHKPDGLQFRGNPLRNPSTLPAIFEGIEHLEGTPGVIYTITTMLRNSEGDSTQVSEKIRLPGPPAAPEAPTVRPEGDTSVTAAWKEPNDDGGSPITGYEVQYQKDGAPAWTEWPHTETGTSATITGLEETPTYNVQVKAKNNMGASDWSPTGTGSTAGLVVQIESGGDITSGNDAVFTVTLSKAATVTVNLTHTWTGEYGESNSGTLAFDSEISKNYTLPTARGNPEADGGSVTVTIDANAAYAIGTGGSATVNVINVNEPPEFPSETNDRTIPENTAADQNIGTPVSATDPDAGETLTYTLGGNDATSFGIVATSGQLQTKTDLDYETKPSYTVTVTATDQGHLSDITTVTITVTNVEETPTLTGDSNINYAENGSETVADYTAVDPEGASITWSLSGDDSDQFSISTSGSADLQLFQFAARLRDPNRCGP